MQVREPRRKVLIKARMRVGASWGDACILDVSSRGLLLQAASPPSRGAYCEVRRGRHVIVARVVWSSHHRFGVRTQDRIVADALIEEPDASGAEPPQASGAEPAVERRAPTRPRDHDHEQSRWRARAIEFACIAIAGGFLATIGFGTVGRVLAHPLTSVQSALGSR